jgi:hypothetical protein
MGTAAIRRPDQRVRHRRNADASLAECERLANSRASGSSRNSHWN